MSPRAIGSLLLVFVVSCAARAQAPLPHVPAPSVTPAAALPAIEPSTIALPVSVSLDRALQEIERVVPEVHDAEGAITVVGESPAGDVGIKYRVWRDPLALSAEGDTLRLRVRAFYRVEGLVCLTKPWPLSGCVWTPVGSCGHDEPAREVVAEIATTIAWRSDYGLTSSSRVASLEFPNRCLVTLARIDVTPQIRAVLAPKLDEAAQRIDQLISEVSFRSQVASAWERLQTPVPVGSTGAVLAIDPRFVAVSNITGRDRELTSTITLAAAPAVWFDERSVPPRIGLPPLEVRELPDGLHVTARAVLPFAKATALLDEAVAGTSFDVEGRRATVEAVEVSGEGETLIAKVSLGGEVSGTIYFEGKIAYDPVRSVVYVADLDYTLATRDVLLGAAEWMLHSKLRERLAAAAQWSVGSEVTGAREAIDASLNRELAPGVHLTGNVSPPRLVSVLAVPVSAGAEGVFVATIAFDGAARLTVR
jgi:hypothetical protein